MRNCPVCDGKSRTVLDPDYMNFELYKCKCGMVYVDRESVTQNWFDHYYTTAYRTDDKPYSEARLDSLASCVKSYEPRSVLDIGGMDGELQKRIPNCTAAGVEETEQGKFDAVVLSHTLEHVYNVPTTMERVKRHLGNRLFIEVPAWRDYDDLRYDYHWQHVNKFTAHALVEMLRRYGFGIAKSERLPDYREYHVQRVIAWCA